MKSLQESLFDSKIQTMESLFDKDLVEKGVDIDFDTLLKMLFDFGKKHQKMFDKIKATYRNGRQSISINRLFPSPDGKGEVEFELQFAVTNIYINFKDKFKLTPGFQAPRLTERGVDCPPVDSDWKLSGDDYYTTLRMIHKKHIFAEDDERIGSGSSLMAYAQDYKEVFSIYDKMVEYFCSDEFGEMCKKYIKMFEFKKYIPGIIIDKMMEKIISKS